MHKQHFVIWLHCVGSGCLFAVFKQLRELSLNHALLTS